MEELLQELKKNDIYISLDGQNIKLRYDQETLPAELIAKIRAKKDDLVTYLKNHGVANTSMESIPSLPISVEGYPLSSAQKRLWVLDQYEEGLASYNITQQITLNGIYDLAVFQKAIQLVIDRHEILRTVFKPNNAGDISQWVLPSEKFVFTIRSKDFSKDADAKKRAQHFMSEDAKQAFDLEKGPLLRAFLLKIDEDQTIFYYVLHHIIGDAWSLGVLAKEVMHYYQAIIADELVQLPTLPIQYKDYASWQIGQLYHTDFEGHQSYWRKSLEGTLPVLNFPSDKTRPPVKTARGQAMEMYLSKTLSSKVKTFAKTYGGSTFITLLSICKVLFYKYTGQEDLLVGSPVSGRSHADLEGQIGFYVNTVVLRNKLDPEASFIDFFRQVKTNVLEAYAHQDYPFDLLLEDLDYKRDVSRSAIFDVLVSMQNTDKNDGGLPLGVKENTLIDHGEHLAKLDLEINFAEIGEHFLFHLNFNKDVYDKDVFSALMNHFVALIAVILEAPDRPIAQLNYMSIQEQEQVVSELNHSQVNYPLSENIISLFDRQVKDHPEKIALTDGDHQYTYAELNNISNQLAHFLQDNYVLEDENFVGILLEPDAWVVIAILAVLKTGSAYVPMGIDHPEERLNYIKDDCNLTICIDRAFIDSFLK